MVKIHYLFFACLISIVKSDDGKRWVWGNDNKAREKVYTGVADIKTSPIKQSDESSARLRLTNDAVPSKSLFNVASGNDQSFSRGQQLRYEVNEPLSPDDNNYRPIGSDYRPTADNYRPIDNSYRPTRPNQGYRPVQRPPNNNFRPTGGYKPITGSNDRPILTGPVPSWEQHNNGRYRDYDRCKCVHSFNCNSPGIQFGSCDIDKKYCCYKERSYGDYERPGDGFRQPYYQDKNPGLLVGPAGPSDSNHGSYRPNKYDRYPNRPYQPNRYSNGYRDREDDLDDAYRKGLETAIIESTHKPERRYENSYEDYNRDTFNTPNRNGLKYGLYVPNYSYDYYGSRSANKTILSDKP